MSSQTGEQNKIWTTKKSIALAKLLKQRPCLWSQTQDEGRKTLISRRNAVISIARALNVSHVQARNEMENLFEYFQRELAKKLGDETYESKWYLFEHLQFLSTKKKIKTNIDSKPLTKDNVTEAEIWTPEKCISLAKLLQQNPCLWSGNDRDRCTKTKISKRDARISIANALNVSQAQAEEKIKNLRIYFRSENAKKLRDESYEPTWYLFEHLTFLHSKTKIETKIDFTPLAKVWTPKKYIALAKLWEQKPCLWSKPQSKDMKTLIEKRDARNSIANALNISHLQAKNKIKRLKDHFQHELAKKLSDESYKPKWYLFKHLQFLNSKPKIETKLDFTEAEIWTRDKFIALAKLWEQKPCLWRQNKDRCATTLMVKLDAMFSIAQALNVSQDAVRKKMIYIKDEFQKVHKQRNKTWYLQKHLKFLNNTMKTDTNMDFTPSTENKVTKAEIWTQEKYIALAKLWEQKPCLWRANADRRMTTLIVKRDAMISIARALNVSHHAVLKKMIYIKHEFQRQRNKPKKTRYLFEHFKFLNGTEKIKTTTDFIPSTEYKVTEAEIWTPEKCVALAKLWEQKPCLWIWRPSKDQRAKAMKARQDAEVSIAQALNVSCHEVHTKMKSIKSMFYRAQKKLNQKTYTPKWYLFKHLKFLNSTKIRETNINFATSTQNTTIVTQKVQSSSNVHDPVQKDILLNDETDTGPSMKNIMMGEAEKVQSPFRGHDPALEDTQQDHLMIEAMNCSTSTANMIIETEQPAQEEVQENPSFSDEIIYATSSKNNVLIEAEDAQSPSKVHDAAQNHDQQDHSTNDGIVSKKDDQTQTCKSCEKRKAEYAILLPVVKNWEERLSSSSTSVAGQTQDQWDLFGACVAMKMRSLRNATSQIQAERQINEILFEKQAEQQKNVGNGVILVNE